MLEQFLGQHNRTNRAEKKNCYRVQRTLLLGVTLTFVLRGYVCPVAAAQTQQSENFKSFAEWCLNKDNLSEAQRHTVEVLLEKVKTTDCNEANESLSNFTSLYLTGKQISDLSPLSNLINLTRLNLDSNQISNLSPLSNLINLTDLNLDSNQISNLSPLSNLNKLDRLSLQENQISDLKPLSNLTNLTRLILFDNHISDLSPLSNLINLSSLDLRKNSISDPSPLSGLTQLGWLYLEVNPIAQKTCPVQPVTICRFSDDRAELYAQAQKQYQQGQFELALASFQDVLALYQKTGDRQRQGDVLNQMGDTYSNLGQYARAIECYQQALPVRQQLGDSDGVITTLVSLSIIYERIGQYQKALEFLEPIWRRYRLNPQFLIGNRKTRIDGGRLFNSFASAYSKVGNYSEALRYTKLALTFYRKQIFDFFGDSVGYRLSTENRYGEANALDAVGVAYLRVGKSEQALIFLEKALERSREIRDKAGEGRVLNHMGEVYFHQGEKQKALELYQQALPLRQQVNDIAGQGETLNNLGLLHFNQGQYTEAEKYLFDAIKVLEALRPGLKDDEKIAIFETQTVTYRLFQKVLIAQNKYNEALEISDRARARAFVELLAQRFTDAEEEQVTPLNLEQIQRIAKDQNATLVEYSLVYDEFNVNGKQQPEESELYIWVIQPTGEITFRRTDLKPLWQQQKTSLDKIVGEARCFENDACRQNLTQGRGVGNIPETRSSGLVPKFNSQAQESQIVAASQGKQQNRPLQQLHQLLIEPIADILPKDPNHRVIFIPQSSLFLAPFPALQDENGTYLIEKHTILSAPSIQVLDLTRQQKRSRGAGEQRSKGEVLIVGNPTMPTIEEFGETPRQLSPLPGAEQEARDIANIFQTTPLIGNQATESVVVQKMPQSRIIHLATHGSFDPERGIGSWIALAPDSPPSRTPISKAGLIDFPAVRPGLNSGLRAASPLKWTKNQPISCSRFQPTLAMSQGINSLADLGRMNQPCIAQGEVQTGESVPGTTNKGIGDGLLKAEEIVDLKLNAELVTLSACDTAQGKITGDGVVGLSRSLISAGTPSVLVSLWKVDDKATAFLMREFYQNWQSSGDKAQALRQAMLTTKQKYSHPTYWAAFNLIGEAE